jgi:uncharacterized protein
MAFLIRSLIVKIAQRCNLNCTYCYIYNHADQSFRHRPVFMSREVFRALAQRIAGYCDAHEGHSMGVVLHGGEPMLLDPRELDVWLTDAKQLLGGQVKYGLQTNGTLVSDEWIDVLSRHGIQPSISIDGTPEAHDAFRVDHAGRGSYEKVAVGLQKLMAAGLDPGALCVINPGHSGVEVYRHLRSLGLKRMDFLIPDATHDSKPLLYGKMGATPVADYLIPIFDEWLTDDDPEIRIKLFVEVIRLLYGGTPLTDNMGASLEGQDYLIIETDGSIHGTDVLKICYEGASDTGLNVLENGFDELAKANQMVFQLIDRGVPLCEECLACPEREVCRGGAMAHRYSRAKGFDNPTAWCADMLKLIDHIRSAISQRDPVNAHRHSRAVVTASGGVIGSLQESV